DVEDHGEVRPATPFKAKGEEGEEKEGLYRMGLTICPQHQLAVRLEIQPQAKQCWPPFTLELRKKAQEILKLHSDARNISLLTIEANFVKYKLYPSNGDQGAEQVVGEAMPGQEEEVTPKQKALKKKKQKKVPKVTKYLPSRPSRSEMVSKKLLVLPSRWKERERPLWSSKKKNTLLMRMLLPCLFWKMLLSTCRRILRALKKRSGDIFGQKSPVKHSKVQDMLPKSIVPTIKTPQLTIEKSSTVPSTEVPEVTVINSIPPDKKSSKSQSTTAPSRGSKGGSTEGLGLPKPLVTPPVLNLET
uniref:Uncharacterized protein n=1 Tax=Cannabis sativa TaxID=3483 RepID=A0A803PDH5_CANSA